MAPPPRGSAAGIGPLGIVGVDKWLHAVAFAAVAAALTIALDDGRRSVVTIAALVVVASTAYGLGIEFLQVPAPGRHFDLADLAADALGAAAVTLAWLAVVRRRRRRRTPDRA